MTPKGETNANSTYSGSLKPLKSTILGQGGGCVLISTTERDTRHTANATKAIDLTVHKNPILPIMYWNMCGYMVAAADEPVAANPVTFLVFPR